MTEAPRKRQKLAPTPEQQTIKQFTSDFKVKLDNPRSRAAPRPPSPESQPFRECLVHWRVSNKVRKHKKSNPEDEPQARSTSPTQGFDSQQSYYNERKSSIHSLLNHDEVSPPVTVALPSAPVIQQPIFESKFSFPISRPAVVSVVTASPEKIVTRMPQPMVGTKRKASEVDFFEFILQCQEQQTV